MRGDDSGPREDFDQEAVLGRPYDAGEAARDFLAFIESLPRVPWNGTAEPADDKRLIGKRFE